MSREQKILVFISFILLASFSFALGRLSLRSEPRGLSVFDKEGGTAKPVTVEMLATLKNLNSSKNIIEGAVDEAEGSYVASINGSKYYHKSCKGAKRIKSENRVYFKTLSDAEEAGYSPAKNCSAPRNQQ